MSTIPAGSHTRARTSSWNGTPLVRSAISASTTKPPLQYANRSPGGKTVGNPSSTDEVVLGRDELLDGHRQHVVGDLVTGILVEVVADARPVREQVLDRHAVVDQREIVAEHRTCRRLETERAFLDEAHHGERRPPLHAAREREPRVDGVGDRVPPVGESVRLRELELTGTVDPHDAGEVRFPGGRIDLVCERHHRETLSASWEPQRAGIEITSFPRVCSRTKSASAVGASARGYVRRIATRNVPATT